jgi:hypothetical protein
MDLQQCPCCDYFTLDERYDWDICPVCFWEDEPYDPSHPDSPAPANHGLTLRQARANFRDFGACEAAMLKHVCSVEDRRRYRHEPRDIR